MPSTSPTIIRSCAFSERHHELIAAEAASSPSIGCSTSCTTGRSRVVSVPAASRAADRRAPASSTGESVASDRGRRRPGRCDGGLALRAAGDRHRLRSRPDGGCAAASGRAVLGIDISRVGGGSSASARGGQMLRRELADQLPGEGRWGTALLLDGNVGIGGDVARC